MAGLTVTVCLPPQAADDVPAALETVLAPFDIDSDNPPGRGMWDSYRIFGGSDGNGFAVVEGHWDDPRLLRDMPRWNGEWRPNAPGVCAGGPRGLLDFSRPGITEERVHGASWDLWHDLAARHPPATPLSSFEHSWESDPDARAADPDRTAMFAAYRAQPLVQAYLDDPRCPDLGSYGRRHVYFRDPVVAFTDDRTDHIRPSTAWRWYHRHILTLDGWWIEPHGEIVHGPCEPQPCSHTPPPIVETEAHLATLPDDTILVRLHCHG